MASSDQGGEGSADTEFEDIAGMTFEQAMGELEEIVRRLEGGQIDLEGAISAYARGAALKRHCDGKLRAAEMRVNSIAMDADGTVRSEAVDNPNETGS